MVTEAEQARYVAFVNQFSTPLKSLNDAPSKLELSLQNTGHRY
jgi:hypothetical protein